MFKRTRTSREEQLLAPILRSIHKKLCHSFTLHLSLIGSALLSAALYSLNSDCTIWDSQWPFLEERFLLYFLVCILVYFSIVLFSMLVAKYLVFYADHNRAQTSLSMLVGGFYSLLKELLGWRIAWTCYLLQWNRTHTRLTFVASAEHNCIGSAWV